MLCSWGIVMVVSNFEFQLWVWRDGGDSWWEERFGIGKWDELSPWCE
jgi:hypothetical protein